VNKTERIFKIGLAPEALRQRVAGAIAAAGHACKV
jgi:hypothetical protein